MILCSTSTLLLIHSINQFIVCVTNPTQGFNTQSLEGHSLFGQNKSCCIASTYGDGKDNAVMVHAQSMVLLLLQVQDINLLHTLVAGCLSYREWLERRDRSVSTVIHSCYPISCDYHRSFSGIK